MAGWSGFTEEDLHRLKIDSEADSRENQKRHISSQKSISTHNIANVDEKSIRPQQQNRRKMPLKKEKDHNAKEIYNSGVGHHESVSNVNETSNDKQEKNNTSCRSCEDFQMPVELLATQTRKNVYDIKKEASNLTPIADEEVAELELNNLVNLQKRQKEIEEENKKKKQIISNTISERFKKAQHEASTLQNVQKELVALDSLLAKDVEILRSKIEGATLAFSIAQRRYDKIEKEFVDAKLDLKLKSDIKEELTQHLYTIIEENEIRKSKKLGELINKLQVAGNQTDCNCTTDNSLEKAQL